MKKSPLRKMSKKRQAEDVIYKRNVADWIQERVAKDGYLRCEFVGKPIASSYYGDSIDEDERCVMAAMTSPHHMKRRGKYLTIKRYFMADCLFHHDWIESHKNEARKRGYILYK